MTNPAPSAPGYAAVREQLHTERANLVTQVDALTREFDGLVASGSGSAGDDEHDPEGSTLAFERMQVDALRSQALDRMADLDRALDRLEAGTYGRCQHCGGPIAAERLAARPAADSCISCAAARSA